MGIGPHPFSAPEQNVSAIEAGLPLRPRHFFYGSKGNNVLPQNESFLNDNNLGVHSIKMSSINITQKLYGTSLFYSSKNLLWHISHAYYTARWTERGIPDMYKALSSGFVSQVHCHMGNTISLWSSKTCCDGPNSLCKATWSPENVLWRHCSVSNLYMIGRYWYCAYAWSTLSWTGPWSDWVAGGVSTGSSPGRTLQKGPSMNYGDTTHWGHHSLWTPLTVNTTLRTFGTQSAVVQGACCTGINITDFWGQQG